MTERKTPVVRVPCGLFVGALLCFLLSGCAEVPLYKKDPGTMDPTERAKHITALWQGCRDGVEQWRTMRDVRDVNTLKGEDARLARIKVLEDARPYGEEAFRLAPNTAHQATYWLAWCLTFLGWEWKDWADFERSAKGRRQEKAEEYEAKARESLRRAIGFLLHYERTYYPTHPNPKIYEYLEANYELLGDNRTAYIVARKYLGILRDMQRRSPSPDVGLEKEIERWNNVVEKLRQKLIDNLQPIPELRGE